MTKGVTVHRVDGSASSCRRSVRAWTQHPTTTTEGTTMTAFGIERDLVQDVEQMADLVMSAAVA